MQNSQVHGQVQQARAGRAHSHRTQPQSQLTPAGRAAAEPSNQHAHADAS